MSPYSTFLLFPFGAAHIRGVYVTVRVTISRTWRTPPRLVFGLLTSNQRPLSAISQSCGLRALKGERMLVALIGCALYGLALRGERPSLWDKAGEGGMRRRMREVEGAEVG